MSGFLEAGFLQSDLPVKRNFVRCTHSSCGQWLVELDPTGRYVVANNGEYFPQTDELSPRVPTGLRANDEDSKSYQIALSNGDRVHCTKCTTESRYRDRPWTQLVRRKWTIKQRIGDSTSTLSH
jgi:hypothetical protein